MLRFRMVVFASAFVLIAAACGDGGDGDGDGDGGGAGDTGEVSVFSAMEPFEAEALQGVVDELVTPEVDYQATIEGSAEFEEQVQIRIEGGNPPDLAMYPQPGAVIEQAEAGNAIALEDLGFDLAELEGIFGDYLLSLGEFEGKHYGIPTNINAKSIVWYAKDDFDAAGYTVPTTFDEMIQLSQDMVDNGDTPWCIGLESGTATGWPATDWMEEIVLRGSGGTEVYDQWVSHEIPFNDPAIVEAGERFGQILFGEGFVLGGADQTPSVAFGDAPNPMFQDPARCMMHRQANFILAFFQPPDVEAGTDYDTFPFPPIDQEGYLIAGELTAIFRDAPEVRDFVERFISQEVQCAQGENQETSRISPNVEVGSDCYTNPILAQAAGALTENLEAGTARFDASDLMPSEVGAGSFWTGMVEYVQGGPDSLQGVLDDIEASWPAEE